MGLMNTPATFMQIMNNFFTNMLNFGIAVFLENILVYLHTVKEHFTLLKKIPVHLCQYTFYCKLKKCSFLCNSTEFLGFDITLDSMCISDLKVWSLKEWPVTTTVKKVQLFLGFVQYFPKFA